MQHITTDTSPEKYTLLLPTQVAQSKSAWLKKQIDLAESESVGITKAQTFVEMNVQSLIDRMDISRLTRLLKKATADCNEAAIQMNRLTQCIASIEKTYGEALARKTKELKSAQERISALEAELVSQRSVIVTTSFSSASADAKQIVEAVDARLKAFVAEAKNNTFEKWPRLCRLVWQRALPDTDPSHISQAELHQYISYLRSTNLGEYQSLLFEAISEKFIPLKKTDSWEGFDARFIAVGLNAFDTLRELLCEDISLFGNASIQELRKSASLIYEGSTLLHFACQEGYIAIASWLISQGLSITEPILSEQRNHDQYYGWAPVMFLMLPTFTSSDYPTSLVKNRLIILDYAFSHFGKLDPNWKIGTYAKGEVKNDIGWFLGKPGGQKLNGKPLLDFAVYMGMEEGVTKLIAWGASSVTAVEQLARFNKNPDENIQSNLYVTQREGLRDRMKTALSRRMSSAGPTIPARRSEDALAGLATAALSGSDSDRSPKKQKLDSASTSSTDENSALPESENNRRFKC